MTNPQTTIADKLSLLERQSEAVTAELTALELVPLPGAVEFVRQADAAIADYQSKVAGLRAKRDHIDNAFMVTKREAEEAKARAAAAALLALADGFAADHEACLQAVDGMEHHLAAAFDCMNKAIAHAEARRAKAAALTGGNKIPNELDVLGFKNRLAEQTSALWRRALNGALRFGSIVLTGGEIFKGRESGWRAREETRTANAAEQMGEYGGRS
jgi:hypothetical protein